MHLGQAVPPSAYCTAKTNSLGCTPGIEWSGFPSLSLAGGLIVSAHEVRNQKPGILVWSRAPAATPFQGGTLCLAPSIARTPVQNSGGDSGIDNCSGRYDFAFSTAFCSVSGILPGDTIHAQYWMRDPGASFNVGLTNAVSFVVVP